MKKTTLKSGLISDFFSGYKSQKTSSSSSPHLSEPEVEVYNQMPHIQEETICQEPPIQSQVPPQNETRTSNVESECVYDADRLPHDPGKRFPISSYPLNDQDLVRRGFIAKGGCRPRNHNFPQTDFGNGTKSRMLRFQPNWFDNYHWLEYSVEKDAAFCFVCYLFKDKTNYPGGDTFVSGGFVCYLFKDKYLLVTSKNIC